MTSTYTKVLTEIAHDMVPISRLDGNWAASNTGLVAGERKSPLVGSLFDKRLTKEMLEATSPVTARRPIRHRL